MSVETESGLFTVNVGKLTFVNMKNYGKRILQGGLEEWNLYKNSDIDITVGTTKNRTGFVLYRVFNKLSTFSGESLTESELINFAKAYLDTVVDNIDYSEYTPTFQTKLRRPMSIDFVDGFYAPSNEDEDFVYCTLTFRKSANGILTDDFIRVFFDQEGNITEIRYFVRDIDVDWSESEVNVELAEQAVVSYAVRNFYFVNGNKKYVLSKSYEIKSMNLQMDYSGKVMLNVRIDVSVLFEGSSDTELLQFEILLT